MNDVDWFSLWLLLLSPLLGGSAGYAIVALLT